MPYKTIRNVRNSIEKKLKELGLHNWDPVQWFIKTKHHTYYSFCQDKKGEKYFFKARIMDDEKVKKCFRREFWFFKYARRIPFSRLSFTTHRLLKGGTSHRLDWMLLDYIKGQPMGDPNKEKKALKLEYIPFLVKNILDIQKHLTRYLLQLPGHNYWLENKGSFQNYKKIIESYISSRISNKEKKLIERILKDNRNLLNKSARVISHADLNPKNILLINSKKTAIHDWEHVHLNNKAYDFALLWVTGWRSAEWRDKLLKEILKHTQNKKEFMSLFRIGILLFSLKEIKYGPPRGRSVQLRTFHKYLYHLS